MSPILAKIMFSPAVFSVTTLRGTLKIPNHRTHYANMSVQYTPIFHGCKNDYFRMKIFDIFLIFAQNIDCGYTLEPPGSNEYPQSMFWSKNKKKYVYPSKPHFFYIIVGCKGVFITRTCYPDV